MAVTPDPVGAYNQSFQTADTSRRDYERLEMQRQQQAEAAIQRAREQKANDFKMMMEAIGRRDDLKQRVFENDIRTKQLANDTVTAQANAYRARNPISRSGQGMLDISPPGLEQPSSAIPGDGTTPSEVSPVGEGSVNASGSSANGAEADLPMADGGDNQPNLLLPQILPPTAASGTAPDLLPGELMLPPQAPTYNTPPAAPSATPSIPLGSPGLLPVSTPAFTPTPFALNAGLMPRTVALAPTAVPAMDVPNAAPATSPQAMPQLPAASTTAPAVSAPVPRRNDLMGYMLNRTDPYTDRIDIPRVAQMPEVPVFGQADIATQGRDQLKQLASVIETARMARAQAPRNIDDARSLIRSGKLLPSRVSEWNRYIKQQDAFAAASASIEGEATQQLLEAKENIKGIESRQGALNRLGNLNGVLPIGDRRQIYQEASDPGMAQLAEQKIAVLTEYDAFRQLNGITNASRGYRTAEQVVLAKREIDSKDAETDRKLVENAQAYQDAIKSRPDMDDKTKAEFQLEIGKANFAQARQNKLVNRLNDALKADRLPTRPPATDAVRPEDIKVNPATGTAAPVRNISLPISASEKKAAETIALSNNMWNEMKRQALPTVTDMQDNVLQAIVSGQRESSGMGGFSTAGSARATSSGPKMSKVMADTYLKDFTLPTGYNVPALSGRSAPLTAEDALIAAARDELRRRNPAAAVPAMPQQTQAAASSVLQKFALPLPPEFGK
jgi:hypothetical protein